MSTINDVAKIAGVSIATVSNYINKTRNVRPNTAEKIQNAIDELNFQPNAFAKNLKSNVVKEVGIILPTLDDPYYTSILKGIESTLRDEGYDTFISFTEDIPEKENSIVNKMLSKTKAGMILVTCQPDNTDFFKKKLVDSDIPYVLVDRKIEGLDSNLIVFDNYMTIKYLVTEMVEKNMENIVLITGPSNYHSENECIRGYKKAFKQFGKEINEKFIMQTDLSKEDAFKNMINTLQNYKIDAIITTTTITAKGALEAAYIRNIPNISDVMVICLGEEIWNRHSNLIGIKSTMRTPYNMGTEAAKLLINNMNKPILFEKKTHILPDRIIGRKGFINHDSYVIKTRTPNKSPHSKIRVLMLEGPGAKPIEGLLPNFITSTGIDVEIIAMEQGDLLDEIIEDIKREESLYDVYMYDIPWLNHLAKCGALYKISKLKNEYKIYEKDYLPNIFKYFCQHEGGTYGLPYIYGPQLLFYRKDIFENKDVKNQFKKEYGIDLKPPKTWSEFNAVAKFFTRKFNPDSPVEYGTSVANDSSFRLCPEFYMRLWSFGSRLIDREGNLDVNNEAFSKALNNFSEVTHYTKDRNGNETLEETVEDFIKGKTAMIVSYATYIPDINNRFVSDVVGKIGYSHVPGGMPVLSGWSLGISKKSNHVEDAFKFIKWACGNEICEYFTILKGQSPLARVYNNDDLLKMYPWLSTLYETNKYCKARKYPSSGELDYLIQKKVEEGLFEVVNGYMNGIYDEQTASDRMDSLL